MLGLQVVEVVLEGEYGRVVRVYHALVELRLGVCLAVEAGCGRGCVRCVVVLLPSGTQSVANPPGEQREQAATPAKTVPGSAAPRRQVAVGALGWVSCGLGGLLPAMSSRSWRAWA